MTKVCGRCRKRVSKRRISALDVLSGTTLAITIKVLDTARSAADSHEISDVDFEKILVFTL